MSQILSVDVFGKKKKENAKEESEDDKSSSDEDEASCTGCGGQTQLQKAENERNKE